MDLKQDFLSELEPRIRRLAWVMLVCIGLVGMRLYYLQGIRGSFYRFFSEENSIREMTLPAARGRMWDRHSVLLADNRPAFDLVVIPQYVIDPTAVFATLQKYLRISEEVIRRQWEKRLNLPPFKAIPIQEDVSAEAAAWVRTHKNPWGKLAEGIDLRGVEIQLRYARDYAGGDIASHVLGYVREIDAERLPVYQKKWPGHYQPGDQIGVRGLEEVWDIELRGADGFKQKIVNAVGREIVLPEMEDELLEREASHGQQLRLTLDARLHKAARDYFQQKNKGGGAVALDPNTGAVLLLYSAPSFDLNRLAGSADNVYWQEIAASPKKYLLNRTIQGAYPPGSTYKIITGTAALQTGVVKPEQTFYCPGFFYFGGRSFRCWRSAGHGTVAFFRGLVASCDVYFYNLGLKVGVDRLAETAHRFGLGEATGIGLKDERSGLIPTSAWKKKVFDQEWFEGETLSIAIGQGADLVTPLQAARMIAVVANGGKRVSPYLVESVIDPKSGKEEPAAKPKAGESGLDPKVLRALYEALVGVVANPEGTAHRLSALQIPMGGKTGTSQVISLGKQCVGDICEDHAWFVAFAPAENPRIAVAVVVEHGGHGSSAAAPLAGELIKIYLNEKT